MCIRDSDKPSYSMDLDGEIEEDDMEDYANEILSSLDTNIDTTNMVVTTDTVNDTLTMTSPNGDKVVVSTEDGKTKVVIYSENTTENETYEAVESATQNKDTAIETSPPTKEEPNVEFVEVTVETSQVTVDALLVSAEDTATAIATNLGITNTASYVTTVDATTGKVVLTADKNGETVTIEIVESNGKHIIKVAPSVLADSNDLFYNLTNAVNTALQTNEYDSNDIEVIEPGTYIELNTEFEDENEANNAQNNLTDTNDTNTGIEVSVSRIEETQPPAESEPEPTTNINVDMKIGDDSNTVSNEEFLNKVSDTMGTTVQDKPSYTIALDTKITSADRESFAQSIASNLSGTVESTTTETDPNYSWISITTVVTSTGEKVVLTTDNEKTSVEIFSETINESTSFEITNTALATTDTGITPSPPTKTEPNATFVDIEEETTEVTVSLLPDPETDAKAIAGNLGLDSANLEVIKDSETGAVTVTTTNDDGDTITIQISEKNGSSVIKISPSTITDATDTTYDIITAVNEVTDETYDSNEFTVKTPGRYLEINVDMDSKEAADNAVDNLNDTTDTNLGAEVEKSKVEETYTPEPEPTTTSNTTLKVNDTATSADELLEYISQQTGTTVQDKKSYTIELDSLIASSAREAFAQMIISKLGGVAGLATTETDATSSWISNTTVVSTN